MRYRITVRGLGIELRGYVDQGLDEDQPTLIEFANAMEPFGVVVASPAEPDYDPFTRAGIPIEQVWQMQADVILGERALREEAQDELRRRELHHFETEQIVERVQKIVDAQIGWETPALLRDTIIRALKGPLT